MKHSLSSCSDPELKPFVKWVGGKRQILSNLWKLVPKNNQISCYFEPFLGGGALFLKIKPKKAFVSDLNSPLITLWQVVQNFVSQFISELKKLASEYCNVSDAHKQQFFCQKRKDYNQFLQMNANQKKSYKDNWQVKQSVLFVFLNRTGYNGLYRVNAQGQFNVPWNKNKKVNFDQKNVEAVSNFLQKQAIAIVCCDFEQILAKVNKGDFVYLDPPYDFLTKNTFTSYQKEKFPSAEQDRLATFFKKLDKKGCLVMLSNHKTEKVLNLYKDYFISHVFAKRMINCKGQKRGAISELIITNYQP